MTDNETSKANAEEMIQESTAKDGNRLNFIHELIEVIIGSFTLIVPVILLILWIYRTGICRFYNLPNFYSSLNIIRFLPIIICGVFLVLTFWILNTFDFTNFYSVSIAHVSQKNEEEQIHSIKQEKKRNTVLVDLLFIICPILFVLLLLVILIELDSMSTGVYPYYFKNGKSFEAPLVLMFAGFVIIIFILVFRALIKGNIDFSGVEKSTAFYSSRRLKSIIIRVSSPALTRQTMKRGAISFMTTISLIYIILLIWSLATYSSYFKTNYYVVEFDDVKYAIVLDTDEYYIGEPIEITELDNNRCLIIHTDAYVYLDKAENPVVVRTESFDSVTILRE